MDLVIREYEITSRRDGATLIMQLQELGYNIKLVISNISQSARIPELSYYQVWSDGTITRDDAAIDLDDVKAVNYTRIDYQVGLPIEPLIII